MNDELELKYAVGDPAAVMARLDQLFPPAEQEAGWREYTTRDRIFDTADGALLAAGYGARLRLVEGRTIVGLKSDVSTEGGLHHRRELEAPATPRLDPADWPPSEPREIVTQLAQGRRLRERFQLRQHRRERAWQAPQGSCVLSLDQVLVRHGRRELGRLEQLEVELRGGGPELLREMDRAILASGLARHEPLSKMALAAQLVALRQPLRADEPIAEAGRRVLGRHLERMLERELAVRSGDELALKQMRVATRRMRATWRLFGDAYRRPVRQRYVAALRRVADRLGGVRDLDVLLELLPADATLQPLRDSWRGERTRAWHRLRRLLDSQAYQHFAQDYRDFVATPGAGARRRMVGVSLADRAALRVESAYERVLRHDAQVAAGDVAALHALRIDGKRLRYALETFAEILPEEPLGELLDRLRRMQDQLGQLSDADVAAGRATAWLNDEAARAEAPTQQAVEAYLADRRAEMHRLQSGFGRAWRAVSGRRFRRLLKRALAPLA